MLLMKDEACPICYEVRSLAIQCGLGIAYPMVLGPLSALMVNQPNFQKVLFGRKTNMNIKYKCAFYITVCT